MKILITVLALFLSTLIWSQNQVIYFDTDKSAIRSHEQLKLDKITQDYFSKSSQISLIGHCDKAGSNTYNQILSQKRVEQVKLELIQRGVSAHDISTSYKGKSQAMAVAQKYRKVDVFYIVKSTPNVSVPHSTPKEEISHIEQKIIFPIKAKPHPHIKTILKPQLHPVKEHNYSSYVQSILPKKEFFTLKNTEEQFIKGKKGTDIRIPKNAFVFLDGTAVQGEVQLELKEYYSTKDFISDRLSTISQGNLLKSLGMIHLKATSKGKEVKLADQKDLEILFPNSPQLYSTFYGKRDKNGIINWIVDERYTNGDINKVNLDDFGVTTTEDGKGLELVSKKEVKKRNQQAKFKGMTGILREVSEEEIEIVKEKARLWKAKKKEKMLLRSNQLGYINCDRFMDGEVRDISITVQLKNKDLEPLSAFVIFKNIKSMIEIPLAAKDAFFINGNMPLNENVHLVVTAQNKEEKLFLYEEKAVLKIDNTYNVQVSPSSYNALDALLSGL